ncbi:MAG: site-specific DNA-methyltransferase [Stenotrophomonas sp.]
MARQLAELVPEAVADGKLDVEKLRELLAGNVAEGNERFGLFWPGKQRALRAAQAPTTATLKPDMARSREWDTTQNVFIEGDNLEVLKTLQRHYHNKIKLIYIDPPYNTGKDFVYPDNYVEGLDTYLEWTRQVNEEGGKVSSNPETAGRYHSNWLNMMYPRLKLARNLLTDDGVIFISIDDNEMENLKKICNEIFGESNFEAMFVWQRKQSPQRDATNISATHDYILAFSRRHPLTTQDGVGWRARLLPMGDGQMERYRNPDNDLRGPWTSADLTINTTARERPNKYFPITNPVTGESVMPSENRTWIFDANTMAKVVAESRLWWGEKGTNFPRLKAFLSENQQGVTPQTILLRTVVGDNQAAAREMKSLFSGKKVFDTPKPSSLLKHLCFVGNVREADIVLDFFAGSSTTAHAVMQLNAEDDGNRRFIMVQLPEPTPEDSEARKAGFATIADISRKRIELAGGKIKAEAVGKHVDVGFRAYTLADTNFSKWHVSSDIAPDALGQHLLDLRDSANDDASADDLLTELLLKLGYSLSERIDAQSIAGLEVRVIGGADGKPQLLACLDEHITPTLEQLRALVDAEPARLIVLEDALGGDDVLKTNLAQYARSKEVELWTA